MFKRVAIGGFCLMLLAGCDDASKIQVGEPTDKGPQQNAQRQAESTALYLPGGAGIDFGRLPVSDKILEDKSSKIRIVVYEFKELYDVVDKSVASVLEAKEYARKVNAPGRNQLSASYLKKGATPVLFRYSSSTPKGVESKTFVTVSWRF
ncbi:hypothetical protein [Pseudomonas sp. 2FE]|uniref:hypothetical protein n=1 Tax=Pseudomonas sp. 2FE TaxID=2502190 RepID=UPI0010FA133E|nr:hypothetical protein [Pseudomonas sp. 2FE]